MEVPLQPAKRAAATNPCSGSSSFAADIDVTDGVWFEGALSDTVSAGEISELISGALRCALLATAEPCPRAYLAAVENQQCEDIIERMSDLPLVQQFHPVVQAEVFKEIAMIRSQGKLANEIVESIRNYSRSMERAEMSAMA